MKRLREIKRPPMLPSADNVHKQIPCPVAGNGMRVSLLSFGADIRGGAVGHALRHEAPVSPAHRRSPRALLGCLCLLLRLPLRMALPLTSGRAPRSLCRSSSPASSTSRTSLLALLLSSSMALRPSKPPIAQDGIASRLRDDERDMVVPAQLNLRSSSAS